MSHCQLTPDDITKFNLLHYFGSRHQAISQLKPYFPPFTNRDQIYFDPFMGSLILPFNLNPKSVVLNDINGELYNFWMCVKDHANELAKEMEYIWIGEDWFYNLQKRADPIGKAMYFYISHLVNRGYDSDTFKHYYKIYSLIKDFSIWKQWFDSRISCTIWKLDFREILTRIGDYDSRDRYVVYCDPPFYVQGKNYPHAFTDQDHTDLSNLCHELKNHTNVHLFLSYDDSPVIRNLYADFYFKEIAFHVGSGKNRDNTQYHELLISNRPFKQYTSGTTKSQTNLTNLLKK